MEAVRAERAKVEAIVLTHAHIDHCFGASVVREATGAHVLMHEQEVEIGGDLKELGDLLELDVAGYEPARPDRLLRDGDAIAVGDKFLKVLHTPGHTPGGICLLGDGVLFSGDTLFAGSVGRTDLPGGDWEVLMDSIHSRLLTLPDDLVVYPGHRSPTTIGDERRDNPFL